MAGGAFRAFNPWLFLPTGFHLLLASQRGVDAQPVATVVDDPASLLPGEALDFPDLAIVGVQVVELHLKRRMLLYKHDRLDIAILERLVITDIEHRQEHQGGCDQQ